MSEQDDVKRIGAEPAFPVFGSRFRGEDVEMSSDGGMTLRQWYAGLAMQGLLAAGRDAQYGNDSMEDLARSSGWIADAMLRELAK
jgi:predicted porin